MSRSLTANGVVRARVCHQRNLPVLFRRKRTSSSRYSTVLAVVQMRSNAARKMIMRKPLNMYSNAPLASTVTNPPRHTSISADCGGGDDYHQYSIAEVAHARLSFGELYRSSVPILSECGTVSFRYRPIHESPQLSRQLPSAIEGFDGAKKTEIERTSVVRQ